MERKVRRDKQPPVKIKVFESQLEKFRQDIARERKARKLSYIKVGAEVGVSSACICRYELGRLQGINSDTFLNLCVFFDLMPLNYVPTLVREVQR